jgi:hypothetical protein
MQPEVDTTRWSGEGAFTQLLVDRLREIREIRLIRVEDAPASRSDADYNFISNEVFVAFASIERRERIRRFGVFPGVRAVVDKAMSIGDLGERLAGVDGIGTADYADAGMLQYLRTERIVPPYQTRGYKLVELVRVYDAGAPSRR